MTQETRWFAAKSLYRTVLRGSPEPMDEATREASILVHPEGLARSTDGGDARDASVVEERVVLIAASDADEALAKAATEAAEYASRRSFNDYSQAIERTVLSYLEVYSIEGQPRHGSELFSRLFLAASRHSDEELVKRLCPQDELAASLRGHFEPNLHLTTARLMDLSRRR